MWQVTGRHVSFCLMPRDVFPPFPLSVYSLASVLLPFLNSPSFHPSITFPPSPLLSCLPSLPFDFLPLLSRGVPVSITQSVSSRDKIGVIGVEVSVCKCVCVYACVRPCFHGTHNCRSLFHCLLMRCDLCLVESWTDDCTPLPPLRTPLCDPPFLFFFFPPLCFSSQ